jgi:hypothetical protein
VAIVIRTTLTTYALIIASVVMADEAPLFRIGVNLQPVESTAVQMIEEEVWITVTPARVFVKADFTFMNTDSTTTIIVGFPDVGSAMVYPYLEVTTLKNFKVEVMDTSVELKRELVEASNETKRMRWFNPGYWFTFPVKFPQGKEVTSSVEYWMYPMPSGHAFSYLQERRTRYSLKTGAAWQGPIGKATIHVQAGSGANSLEFWQDGWKQEDDGSFTLVLKGEEPEFDIGIEYLAWTPELRQMQLFSYIQEHVGWTTGVLSPPRNIPEIHELGGALSDLILSSWALKDFAAVIEACQLVIEVEEAIAKNPQLKYKDNLVGRTQLPNTLGNFYESNGTSRPGCCAIFVPCEVPLFYALLRLGETEEARQFAIERGLPKLKQYLDWARKDRTSHRWEVNWEVNPTVYDWSTPEKVLEDMARLVQN